MALVWIAGTDSARRLFERRYLSGDALAVVEVAGGLSVTPGAEVVIASWGVPLAVREAGDVSSFEPAFWPRADSSDEDEDDVVEIEGLAGYRDRFAAAPES